MWRLLSKQALGSGPAPLKRHIQDCSSTDSKPVAFWDSVTKAFLHAHLMSRKKQAGVLPTGLLLVPKRLGSIALCTSSVACLPPLTHSGKGCKANPCCMATLMHTQDAEHTTSKCEACRWLIHAYKAVDGNPPPSPTPPTKVCKLTLPVTIHSVWPDPLACRCSMASSMLSTSSRVRAAVPYSCLGLGARGRLRYLQERSPP